MNNIRNYYLINNNIATSGQPTEAQFAAIAAAGYSLVINLAMPDSMYALANEGEILESLKMEYVHIPVVWDDPRISDLHRFFEVMQAHQNQKIWVHCALNKRVSCFIYLYNVCILKRSESESAFPMSEIWQPTGVWQTLIDSAISEKSQY